MWNGGNAIELLGTLKVMILYCSKQRLQKMINWNSCDSIELNDTTLTCNKYTNYHGSLWTKYLTFLHLLSIVINYTLFTLISFVHGSLNSVHTRILHFLILYRYLTCIHIKIKYQAQCKNQLQPYNR